MNRIRIYNNKFQVLITPTILPNASFEMIIDQWYDENFIHFYIKEYEIQAEAMCEALNYPDIDWYKLVNIHRENYNMYNKMIREIVEKNKMVVEIESILIEPNILKHLVFDKVMQSDYDLKYGLHEIISYKIINPWTNNIKRFANIFMKYNELNIYDNHVINGKIILNGKTTIGTTYEIILMPSLIYHIEKWIDINKEDSNISLIIKNVYPQMIKIQEEFDKTPLLR